MKSGEAFHKGVSDQLCQMLPVGQVSQDENWKQNRGFSNRMVTDDLRTILAEWGRREPH